MRTMSREEEISSNYIEITLYNKTKEIEQKIANGEIAENLIKKFINIFRTELKVKNGKLNSNKQKQLFNNKSLGTYYNTETTTKLYNKTVQKIFGINDFYRIDIALEKIKNAMGIRDGTKRNLCRLIKLVNKRGYTIAKKIWTEKYCEATFRNQVKKIESLRINILTFDKKINGQIVNVKKIKNFTLLENGVPEFIDPNNMQTF